jgi:hypothetical protein
MKSIEGKVRVALKSVGKAVDPHAETTVVKKAAGIIKKPGRAIRKSLKGQVKKSMKLKSSN